MTPNLTVSLQIKSLNDREFEGHGSVFGNEDLGGDIVVPGAFAKSLREHSRAGSLPQMFWMHDASRVCGKWTEMREDDRGLFVKGVLAPTPLGDEIRTLLKMDAVKGLSIGYVEREADYDQQGRRLIKDAELWEVSVVSLPMNPLAQVAHAKSRLSKQGEYVPTAKEFERTLREAGCSRKVAKDILHKLYESSEKLDTADETPELDDDAEALAAIEALKSDLLDRQVKRILQR